jgi:hypothetical protein
MRLPTSPYFTRQEEYRDDPWKMLMVCFMLNQTHHRQVDEVREHFFMKCSDPKTLIDCPDQEIIDIIKPLGFYNRRVKAWKEFCYQWLEAVEKYGNCIFIPVSEIEKMKGVGKYALDSWKVFQLFDYDVDPDDHVLNFYVEWAREEKKRILREQGTPRPYSVYYAHFKDHREAEPNWMKYKDYVCCIMARTTEEAIEKTKRIALNQEGAKHIKILGVGFAREEWVDEQKWMDTDPEYYRAEAQLLKQRLEQKRQLDTTW